MAILAVAAMPLFVLGFALGQKQESQLCFRSACDSLRIATLAFVPAAVVASIGAATWVTLRADRTSQLIGKVTLSAYAAFIVYCVTLLWG